MPVSNLVPPPAVAAVAQSLEPDAIINLFTLDIASVISGAPTIRFVQGAETTAAVRFAGAEFMPVDCEFTGLEASGVGSLPTPRIKVANTDGIFQAILNTYGDLLGVPLYRQRTFARFLEGHSSPDGTAYYGPDTYKLERKVDENYVYIEYELSAAIDQQGKMLPGRQVIRDTCLWRYRFWDVNKPGGAGFNYARAQCPYTGSVMFDLNDQPTSDPLLDMPSRRLSCCEARFGGGVDAERKFPLPFGGFPGIARVRA